jgi:hypothetical protein
MITEKEWEKILEECPIIKHSLGKGIGKLRLPTQEELDWGNDLGGSVDSELLRKHCNEHSNNKRNSKK